jgi:hypothetical protein
MPKMQEQFSAKRKYPKKKPPHAALILRSSDLSGVFSKGHPSPCEKRAASLPRPCRANPLKASGGRHGIRG